MSWIIMIACLLALCLFWLALDHIDLRAQARDTKDAQQDIEVLRVAVFNHLRHGGDPCEEHIREVLGFGERD